MICLGLSSVMIVPSGKCRMKADVVHFLLISAYVNLFTLTLNENEKHRQQRIKLFENDL